jgi:hypothetical protein
MVRLAEAERMANTYVVAVPAASEAIPRAIETTATYRSFRCESEN